MSKCMAACVLTVEKKDTDMKREKAKKNSVGVGQREFVCV